MYAWLWNVLPGPLLVKLALALGIVSLIFILIMTVVFPALSQLMPYNDVAV